MFNKLVLACTALGLLFLVSSIHAQEQYLIKTLKGFSSDVKVIEFDQSGNSLLGASDAGLVIWNKDGTLIYRKVLEADLKSKLSDAVLLNEKVFYSRMHDIPNNSDKLIAYGEFAFWKIGSESIQGLFSEEQELAVTKTGLTNVNAIACSPIKNLVAVALTYSGGLGRKDVGYIRLFESSYGSQVGNIDAFGDIRSMKFDASGNRLAAVSKDKIICMWEINSKKVVWSLFGHTDAITSVSFSPNGKYLVTGSDDKTIILWDAYTSNRIRQYNGHLDDVRSVVISPDGNFIASGSKDKTVRVWELNTGKEVITIQTHKGGVNTVCFSPNGEVLASGSDDKTIKLWDFEKIKTDHEGKQRQVAEAKSQEERRIAEEKAEEERRRKAMPAGLFLAVRFSDKSSFIPNNI